MNKRLIDVVKKALEQDNTLAASKGELEKAVGHTEEYLAYLGLSRNDLKKLERQGLALRGYAQEVKKTALGRTVKGDSVRWILVGGA